MLAGPLVAQLPAIPVQAQPRAHTLVADQQRGFVLQPAEAPVSGSVSLVRQGSRHQLVLSPDFRTTNQAPDLHVVLTKGRAPLRQSPPPAYPLAADSYRYIAPLQAISGAQTYLLPEDLDLTTYGSVVIWCRRYNASMAWAPIR
jgi:hypothetical protein